MSLIERRVTVLFSDPYHRLHLIEVKTKVRVVQTEERPEYRVSRNEVEARKSALGFRRPGPVHHPITGSSKQSPTSSYANRGS